ncbi:MAG TPA: hypothetical protein VN666_20750 [Nitrospira sp.]|nr:hypothetical protein [Nitrospira sp.]
MERIVNLHIEKLPEGVYLATSDVIQGLVVQGRTNEAPRSKLRGITELNSEDFSEGEANPVASYGECQVQETIEIARDVAKKLLEATQEREGEPSLPPARDEFDYPLIVNA